MSEEKRKKMNSGTSKNPGKSSTEGVKKNSPEKVNKNTNRNTNNNINKNTHTKTNTGKKSVKKKAQLDEMVRKGFKHTSGFMFSLLINIIIVFVVIRLFSYSFNFAYSVFGDVAKDYSGREYVVIEIPADSSTLQIGKALEDSGIIEDKYVFFAKVRIKKLGGSIKSGKYGLSSSMTYNEIINLICGIEEDEED